MKYILSTALGLMILLSGCLSEKAAVTRLYTIEWSDDSEDIQRSESGLIGGLCEINQVEISPLYEKTQIVNRSGSNEVSYYKYHQWAVRPSVAVTEVIRNYLEGADLFENVSSRFSRAIPDYRFATTIHQLEVIESRDQFLAHLHVEFRIISNTDGSTLAEHRADRSESLAKKELNLFASAISEMLVSELRTFELLIRDQSSEFTQ